MGSDKRVKRLILYSTLGCHLCEQARALMWPSLAAAGYELEEVDISESEQLMTRYQLNIPVAKNLDTGQELFWPFNGFQVEQLITNQ
jgi:glutaredoxin